MTYLLAKAALWTLAAFIALCGLAVLVPLTALEWILRRWGR